ncbi:MAG: pitrilysin family protein [Thermoplasmata archaeon]
MASTSDPLALERGEPINGIELIRQPSPPGTASFSATYVAPAGWSYDPSGAAGAAVLTSALVTSAAGPYDRVELARLLDRYGATLQHDAAAESTEVSIWGPAQEWERLLAIFAEVVMRPRFENEDLDRVRRQILEHQLRELTQPGHRAERVLLETLFPKGHPYRESGLGTRRTISRIGRANVTRFHREHFTSEGALLVVTIPTSLVRLRPVLQKLFKSFDSSPPRRPSLPPVATAPETRMVAMADRSQVEVRIGGVSLSRADPHYLALFLANEVLGGRPLLSRLFQRVRERHGLAYHASSEVEAMRWGGYWVARAGTGKDRWKRVIRLMQQEIRSLSQAPVSASELNRIRESAIGEIPLALETTSGAHELAVDVAYHHLPDDFYRNWPAQLRALRARDLEEAARIGLDGSHAISVLAGPLGTSR